MQRIVNAWTLSIEWYSEGNGNAVFPVNMAEKALETDYYLLHRCDNTLFSILQPSEDSA